MDEQTVTKILVDESVKFSNRAELYKFLEISGLGSAEMWKSRYKRNTKGFGTLVDTYFEESNGRTIPDVIFDEDNETGFTHSVTSQNDAESFEKELRKRSELYQEQTKIYDDETSRNAFIIPHDWSMIMVISDLHLDDAGTNILNLVDTVRHFNHYPQARFVNIGDVLNFWVDPWTHKMALASSVTHKQAMKMLRLINKELGKKQLLFIEGNHDKWATEKLDLDFLEDLFRVYSPNILYRKHNAIVKFYNNSTEGDWIKFAHFFKGGKSMWNPHQSNVKHLLLNEKEDVNMAVTGHLHWNTTSFATFPFETRYIKSLLMGSPKSYDDYALELGYKGEENPNPFAFIFYHDGQEKVITNTEEAKHFADMLNYV